MKGHNAVKETTAPRRVGHLTTITLTPKFCCCNSKKTLTILLIEKLII